MGLQLPVEIRFINQRRWQRSYHIYRKYLKTFSYILAIYMKNYYNHVIKTFIGRFQ